MLKVPVQELFPARTPGNRIHEFIEKILTCTSIPSNNYNKKALGPEHPDTAANLNNLAELYYSVGD